MCRWRQKGLQPPPNSVRNLYLRCGHAESLVGRRDTNMINWLRLRSNAQVRTVNSARTTQLVVFLLVARRRAPNTPNLDAFCTACSNAMAGRRRPWAENKTQDQRDGFGSVETVAEMTRFGISINKIQELERTVFWSVRTLAWNAEIDSLLPGPTYSRLPLGSDFTQSNFSQMRVLFTTALPFSDKSEERGPGKKPWHAVAWRAAVAMLACPDGRLIHVAICSEHSKLSPRDLSQEVLALLVLTVNCTAQT
ncbi:hypothetical protein C8F04DRAFT_1194384 [Mycena alexandri]|uniref:Uncharacterized protein n=1 Tax=Mycena alexandri TaxID=1745969 RepID=A0AAD6S7Z5_9AGAR|nr:hypothetical protein C8F04DRAFT_1194384 [Mycena alexandri]